MVKYNLKDGVWRTIGGRRVFIKNGQDLASAMKESGKFGNKKKVETISKEEYDKMPSDYKGSLKELVDTAEFRGENKAELIKKYEAMGFDVENDKTILKLEKGGTVLTPVKVVDNKPKLTKFGEKKEFTRQELKNRYGTDNVDLINAGREPENRVKLVDDDYKLYKQAKERPDTIDPMTENSTDWEALDRKYRKRYEQDNPVDWREQVKANNEKLERDLAEYQRTHDISRESEGYYELFRQNERRNARIKQEVPTEKYEYVDSYAGYKDKFNDTWGKDGSIDKTVSARMYTNDEFMEHLEDANWHGERRQLLEANLTNQELAYIKDRTKVSAWGVENLTGKEQVADLIQEAKSKFGVTKINDTVMNGAYINYLKQHPNTSVTLNDFKKWFE